MNEEELKIIKEDSELEEVLENQVKELTGEDIEMDLGDFIDIQEDNKNRDIEIFLNNYYLGL